MVTVKLLVFGLVGIITQADQVSTSGSVQAKLLADNSGFYYDKGLYPSDFMDALCYCCSGCGVIANGDYHCKQMSESECPHKMCSSGTQSPQSCMKAKDAGYFSFWPGKMHGQINAPFPEKMVMSTFSVQHDSWPNLVALYQDHGLKYITLDSIVTAAARCVATWDGVNKMTSSPSRPDYANVRYNSAYNEITKFQSVGGQVAITFRHSGTTSLASAPVCAVDPRGSVFSAVIEMNNALKYFSANIAVIEFNQAAFGDMSDQYVKNWKNQFDIVKQLKQIRPELRVIWSFPGDPAGMTAGVMAMLTELINGDTPADYFMVQNADYTNNVSQCKNNMGHCHADSVRAVAGQLNMVAQRTGKASHYGWNSVNDIYKIIGTKLIIGVNHTPDVVTTVEDIIKMFSEFNGTGPRLAVYESALRDTACGTRTSYDNFCAGSINQTVDSQYLDTISSSI